MRDLLTYFIIPGFIALLPWSIARPIMRKVASWDWMLETKLARIEAAYSEWVGEPPPEGWVITHRFHMLMDRVSPFRTAFSTATGVSRQVDRQGDTMPEGAFVAVGGHYGSGLFGFPVFCTHGTPISTLSTPMRLEAYSGRIFLYLFGVFALGQAARLGRAATRYAEGNFIWSLRKLLKRGTSIYGLMDVPGASSRHSRQAHLFGREVFLPTGLVELAHMASCPLVVWFVSVSEKSGHFQFVSRTIGSADKNNAFDEVVHFFSQQLAKDCTPWHAWSWGSALSAYRARPKAD
jgi:lauroyl/myristoyl acyltransferase